MEIYRKEIGFGWDSVVTARVTIIKTPNGYVLGAMRFLPRPCFFTPRRSESFKFEMSAIYRDLSEAVACAGSILHPEPLMSDHVTFIAQKHHLSTISTENMNAIKFVSPLNYVHVLGTCEYDNGYVGLEEYELMASEARAMASCLSGTDIATYKEVCDGDR